MSDLVSLRRAARQLQLQVSTLRGWRLKRIHLDFVKVGGRVCITQESIDDFVKANTVLPLTCGDKASGSDFAEQRKSKTLSGPSRTWKAGDLE